MLIAACLMLMGMKVATAMTDPMQPPAYRGSKAEKTKSVSVRWQLTSTLIGQNRRLATINGKTLGVGKMINGARIVDIQPAIVTLAFQNRRITLKLLPTEVKLKRRINSE